MLTDNRYNARVARNSQDKSFNLFVYGTLVSPAIFQAVLGKRLVTNQALADNEHVFYARRAYLNGYKKISPDNTYMYAVPDRGHRISGYVICDLPGSCLAALMNYEGRNYSRRRLNVQTSHGQVKAMAFVGNVKQLEHSFGYAFRDSLKQEILLDKKIDAVIRETEEEQLHTNEEITRRAVAELSGTRIRDIKRRHFEVGGISDYAIRRSIKARPLPDYQRVLDAPAMASLASNYLRMVIRQVVFNQFEERIRREFRYELDQLPQAETYYDRINSSLIALRILNQNRSVLDVVIADSLGDIDFKSSHLIDYVRRAVAAADALYNTSSVRSHLAFVRGHMGFGHIPLGAELEFSNIGHGVIHDPQGLAMSDWMYDGFLYFYDFGLDKLTWKLGGHIDNHRVKTPGEPRRGFFEVALGNLSIEANISKPITRDPWVLNQLIQQTREFYEVTPHSIHLSMQLRHQRHPDRDRLLPLPVMKCLFAIGGDPVRSDGGKMIIRRLSPGEILQCDPKPGLLFSEISRRRTSQGQDQYLPAGTDKEGPFVQQFRFLRLSRHINYEPIIMGLKGIQLSLRPGTLLTPAQCETHKRHRDLFEALLQWGQNPSAISRGDIDRFLSYVQDGLMSERRGKPAHNQAYIAWSTSQLSDMLRRFNSQIESGLAEEK